MEHAVRERLLDALLAELGRKGYDEMGIDAPLQVAGISQEAFEAEFADIDTALFAAYEQLIDRLTWQATEACAVVGKPWPRRVHRALQALLGKLAATPETARVLTRTFPSIGPQARARYQSFVEEFAPLLSEGRQYATVGEDLPSEVEMLAVGAAEAIVFEEIEAGRAARLPAMVPAVLFSILVPFLGPDGASAEMERAARHAE